MKAIAQILLAGGIIYMSYAAMVYGWGLEVKSWGWVIGGYAALIGAQVVSAAIKES